MRIACVLLEHFAAAVHERRQPDLADLPFVVGGYPHERKPVYDVSAAAAAFGLHPGMPLREAAQRCPQAVFLPLEVEAYAQAFGTVLQALEAFTPIVEEAGLGCAYLDLRGLPLPPDGEVGLGRELAAAVTETTGLTVQVGMARGPFVARLAAERAGSEGVRVVAAGAEAELLAPLPAAVLPLSAEALRRLRLLGIPTLGTLSALSAEAVANQLGAEGVAAHRLARGVEARRLAPRSPERTVAEEREFDDSIEDTARLSLVVDHLVDQLLPRLQEGHLFCARAEVALRLANGAQPASVVYLREPSQDAQTIARAAKQAIAAESLESGVVAVGLTLSGLGGVRGRQLSLFAPRQGGLERLHEAAARLQSRLGSGRLYKAVITDAKASLPERRFALVDYR